MNIKFLMTGLVLLLSSFANAELAPNVSLLSEQPGRFDVDGVVAIIYHPEGTEIILQSDIARRDLDGSAQTLESVIFKRLKYLDAKRIKAEFTEDDVDRELERLQKVYNLSRGQMAQLFHELGYSFVEGRELLRIKRMTDQAEERHIQTSSKLVIDRKDVEAFYNEHPEKKEATLVLVEGVVAKSDAPSREQITELMKNKPSSTMVTWQEPFNVIVKDLPRERQSIISHNVGDIVDIEETDSSWIITKIQHKSEEEILPLDKDLYERSARIILSQRLDELRSEYHQKLLDSARIKLVDTRFDAPFLHKK